MKKLTMIQKKKKKIFRPTKLIVSLMNCLARVIWWFQNQVFMAILEWVIKFV